MDIEKQEIDEWTKIRLKLNQAYKYDAEWEKAIKLFNSRFKKKFFSPIQNLIDQNILKGEGFTILTAQCSLIESFASLRSGEIFDHKKNNSSPAYTYSKSQKMFTGFLNSASIFENIFWIKDTVSPGKIILDTPFIASAFYSDVRCGLMHEARTKGNWFINATPKKYDVRTQKIFIENENGRFKIYRTILHYRLKQYMKDYSIDLRQTGAEADKLRRFFARKMDYMFDFNPDITNFDWWKDS